MRGSRQSVAAAIGALSSAAFVASMTPYHKREGAAA